MIADNAPAYAGNKWQRRTRDKPLYLYTRTELLAEIAGVPNDGYLTARHAAAFLDTNVSVLAQWRFHRRGPKYEGVGKFIRYRISALRDFMAGHADDATGTHETSGRRALELGGASPNFSRVTLMNNRAGIARGK